MSPRTVSNVFQQYQAARAQFSQAVADLAGRPECVDQLLQENVVSLLRTLLTDVSPSIQQNATMAVGRLAGHSPALADLLVKQDLIRMILVFNMDKSNRFLKKTALLAIRAVVKHSAESVKSVIEIGGLDIIVGALEEFDPGVKEGAACAIGYMARHEPFQVIGSGAVPLLTLCLQEPEVNVRIVAASALADIAKHSPESAQALLDAGVVPYLVRATNNIDTRLKRQSLNALASIAKHTMEMSETVIEADIFPMVLEHAGHPDELVRKAACCLIKEVVKHSPELANMVVECGGLGVLVNSITRNKGEARLPGILALGFIAGHSGQLSTSVVYSKGIDALAIALEDEMKNHIGSAAAWALGHIGKHSTEHARHVTSSGILPKLLQVYTSADSMRNSEEMKEKAKQALKMILMRTDDLDALEPLLNNAPPKILKYIVAQYSKVLPCNAAARRTFVTTGGLRKVQELLANDATEGSILREHVLLINACFPPDIINYFSPDYPQTLLERVEQFKPALNIDPSLWSDRLFSYTEIPTEIKDEILSLQRNFNKVQEDNNESNLVKPQSDPPPQPMQENGSYKEKK